MVTSKTLHECAPKVSGQIRWVSAMHCSTNVRARRWPRPQPVPAATRAWPPCRTTAALSTAGQSSPEGGGWICIVRPGYRTRYGIRVGRPECRALCGIPPARHEHEARNADRKMQRGTRTSEWLSAPGVTLGGHLWRSGGQPRRATLPQHRFCSSGRLAAAFCSIPSPLLCSPRPRVSKGSLLMSPIVALLVRLVAVAHGASAPQADLKSVMEHRRQHRRIGWAVLRGGVRARPAGVYRLHPSIQS